MGKKSRRQPAGRPATIDAGEVAVVGPREPCPCGSGKRYKQCHGMAAHRARPLPPARPFDGLAGECDWVALRSFVPVATSPLKLAGDHAGRDVLLATILPLAMPALVRQSGAVWLGTQVQDPGSGDPSRDLGATLAAALELEPGQAVEAVPQTSDSPPRLQDLVEVSVAPQVTVQSDVSFWIDDADTEDPDVNASLERVNAAIDPTERLTMVEAAYWVDSGSRRHLRWVFPHEEEQLLDGLARLHAAGASAVAEGSKLIGSYRAFGLGIPVWELADGTTAEALEEPAAALAERLAEAVAETSPLTVEQRHARDGLLSRQITIR
jgi:hypothetical protein